MRSEAAKCSDRKFWSQICSLKPNQVPILLQKLNINLMAPFSFDNKTVEQL